MRFDCKLRVLKLVRRSKQKSMSSVLIVKLVYTNFEKNNIFFHFNSIFIILMALDLLFKLKIIVEINYPNQRGTSWTTFCKLQSVTVHRSNPKTCRLQWAFFSSVNKMWFLFSTFTLLVNFYNNFQFAVHTYFIKFLDLFC